MNNQKEFNGTNEELDFAKRSISIPKKKSPEGKRSQFSPTDNDLAFAAVSNLEPLKEEIPFYKSIPAAAARGTIQGLVSLGESFGGLKQAPGERQRQEIQRQEGLEQLLPSEQGKIEQLVERGGKILPGALAGPGGVGQALVRTGVAALSGQAAKELGFGETGQAIAELPAFVAPGFGKKILPTKKQAGIVEEARRLGLTEKEIAPLIQSEQKQNILKKFANRGESTQDVLKGSKKAVSGLYDALADSPAAKNKISPEIYSEMISDFKKSFEKIPYDMVKKIVPDIKVLEQGGVTGEKLTNFYQKLNHYIKKGDSQLGLLKGPLTKAMENVSPEFSKDFQITQELYGRSAKIRKALSPKDEHIVTKLINGSAPYRLIGGMLSGYYPLILEPAGEIAGRKIASLMLTNPRYQNLTKQMVKSLADNKIQVANNLKNVLKDDLEKDLPEISAMLDFVDFNELNNHK